MSLSANTLIHFTDTKDKLKKILEENFRIYFCKEFVTLGEIEAKYVAPMVSFCDIPLSEIKNHITKYGNYGIGLTKEWGMAKRLNPVLYLSQTSMLSESIRKSLAHFCDVDDTDDFSMEQKDLFDVARYIKNYEGVLLRKGIADSKYRFSDEREWRYVPPNTEKCDMLVDYSHYSDPQNKSVCDEKLLDLRLDFGPNDIKYIIIKNDDEIGEFIDHLKRAKGNKYSYHDVERLTTRILTVEQIEGDM